jgi:ABC-2 type transport system permease protein
VTFVGTRRLATFMLRLDRLRLALWIGGIGSMVVLTAVSIIGLYPTQADLDAAAQPYYGNTAVIALLGPTLALDTYGGQIVFQLGSFGYAAMGLMGMFLVGRHTRGDEETGRTELLRATVLGRNAPPTAALAVTTGALLALGAAITVIMLASALPVAGSIAYGAAMAGFGITFACVMAVAAQITEHNRTAYALTGAVLGASYLLRAVGDVGNGVLTWFSPMGWAMQVRPYADERWWPLLLLAGASAGLIAVAFWLAAHRDLGSGLVPPRPGPPRAARWEVVPEGFALRMQGLSLVGWIVGLGIFGIAYGSLGQDVSSLIGDSDAIEQMIAQGRGELTDAFFYTSFLTMALIAGGFTVAAVLRLRSEETGGRAEPLLATGLSRPRWAASHLAVSLVGSLVLMAAIGLATGLTYALSIGDMGQVGRLTAAALAFTPALWVLAGLTLALFGLWPRAVMAAWGAVALCGVVGLFGELFGLPSWMMDLSPFQHVPHMPAEGFAAGPILALTAVAAALVAAGMVGFRRRDAGF